MDMTNTSVGNLRAQRLGKLIQEARLKTDQSISECAQILGMSDATFEAYEAGDNSPSLPELELLAYTFQVPLEYFWGEGEISRSFKKPSEVNFARLNSIRQRMIGAKLRKARLEAGYSLESLGSEIDMSPETLENYELGLTPVPVPALEMLGEALKQPIKYFEDQHGPVGIWSAQQRALKDFKELPPELQIFVTKPINRPYLELAQRLSEMSVEKLRAVAEGLLEITL
jgi:transcriptional regulator with XRE-family HTH domain